MKKVAFACTGEDIYSLIPVINLLKYKTNIKPILCYPGNIFISEQKYASLEKYKRIANCGEILPKNILDGIDILDCDFLYKSAPDVLVFTAPFFINKNRLTREKLKHLGIQTAYFPYATEFLGAGYDQWIVNLPHVHDVDMLFASSPLAVDNYKKNSKYFINSLYCVGNPELDILFNNEFRDGTSYWELKKFTNEHFCFLYTPHWSIDKEPFWSSWLTLSPVLYKFFKERPALRLILRPHPLMLSCTAEMAIELRLQVYRRLEELLSLPNIFLDKSASSLTAIALSDCLISDCSSIIQKYWPTGKPIIVSEVDYGLANHIVKLCLEMFSDPDELPAAMLSYAYGDDSRKKLRQKYSLLFAGPFDGKCAQRMANLLSSHVLEKE